MTLLRSMARWAGVVTLAAALLFPIELPATPPPGAVAVIVHPGTNVTRLSQDDLRTLLLGTRRFWDDGARVELLIRGTPSVERTMHLERLCDMSEARFRQYWIGMTFRGRASAAPRPLPTSQAVVAAVAAIPGAVALVDASAVTSAVRVVAVDGLTPDDAGYPLR